MARFSLLTERLDFILWRRERSARLEDRRGACMTFRRQGLAMLATAITMGWPSANPEEETGHVTQDQFDSA